MRAHEPYVDKWEDFEEEWDWDEEYWDEEEWEEEEW